MGHDREFWRRHVAAWRESGLSQRVYSERHGLCRGTLGCWSSKLGNEKTEARGEQLVEVSGGMEALGGGNTSSPPIELVIHGQYLLRLWRGTDPSHLQEVLSVLEGRLR